MRLATVQFGTGTRAVRLEGDTMALLPYHNVGEMLFASEDWHGIANSEYERIPLKGSAPLVPNPSKVICVGLNFARHVKESGGAVPTHSTLFAKWPDSLVGPYSDIVRPREAQTLDWEAELVIVVGRDAGRASEVEAAHAIAGFTVGNDVTVRSWQFRTTQWLQGKAWHGTSPVGPVLATPEETGGVRPDLQVCCTVDGTVMQNSRTSDLLFDPVDLVSYIMKFTTLSAGDLIFSGIPDGVGFARKPPIYLQDDQILISEIEGIGKICNRIVPEASNRAPP